MTWSGPSSLLSRPPVPNYIEFTVRQKANKSKNSVQKCTAIMLAIAKVVADNDDAASTADDVASRAYGPVLQFWLSAWNEASFTRLSA
jgi:hypothetical protein